MCWLISSYPGIFYQISMVELSLSHAETNAGSKSQCSPSRQSVGVFDSGVGGLTVLRQLYDRLPHESILYVADTAHLPYGVRSPSEVLHYTRGILRWMVAQPVKLVIMASHTSSALALPTLRQEFQIPIVGMIEPAAHVATTSGRKIGVIATPATAKSQAYRLAIEAINPAIEVWQVGCEDLVPLIEENRLSDPQTEAIARDALSPLLQLDIDALIYGCTHYSHICHMIRALLPDRIRTIDPAVHAVTAADAILDRLALKNRSTALPTRFFVSGDMEMFRAFSTHWLGFSPHVERMPLSDFSDSPQFAAPHHPPTITPSL